MPLFVDYRDRPTFFGRLDPRTKLLWLVVGELVALTAPHPVVSAVLIVVIVVTSWAAELDLRAFATITKATALVGVTLLVLQILFGPRGTPIARLGPLTVYGEALSLTGSVALLVLGAAMASLQFILWTHPTDLSQLLVKLGVPYRYGMLAGLGLRFFPVLEEELESIMQAQAARGLELDSTARRVLRLLPIMLPFCLRSIRRAGDVALAMELRGFGYAPTRTYLRHIVFRRSDALVCGALALLGGGDLLGVAARAWGAP